MNDCSCLTPVFSIFTGDAKTMSLAAYLANFGGPLDLTSCTQIVLRLPKADGTFLELTKTGGAVVVTSPQVLGKFTAVITAPQSALLNIGELQDFDVTFTIGSDVLTVRYSRALSVFETEA